MAHKAASLARSPSSGLWRGRGRGGGRKEGKEGTYEKFMPTERNNAANARGDEGGGGGPF